LLPGGFIELTNKTGFPSAMITPGFRSNNPLYSRGKLTGRRNGFFCIRFCNFGHFFVVGFLAGIEK
jgi:hypothetical protein